MPIEKRNIFLQGTYDSLPFISKGSGTKTTLPQRDVGSHASFLSEQLKAAYANSLSQKQVAALRYKQGTYLEFTSKEGYDLTIHSLENITQGVRLLNVRKCDDNGLIKATVYVPEGKEKFFIKRIEEYMTQCTPKTGMPKNNALVASIEDIKLALLDSFWISKNAPVPTDVPVWCEVWIRLPDQIPIGFEEEFTKICSNLGVEVNSKSIYFAERLVKLVRAKASQLSEIITSFPYLAEIRRAEEVTSIFRSLTIAEQNEWVKELLDRVVYNLSNTTICVLDTGINSNHPLLQNVMDENSTITVEQAWGINDHDGHGTEVAGIALFHDLQQVLSSTSPEFVEHRLESVKILPPSNNNDPALYGAITQQGIYLAEIANPNAYRINCLTVTSDKYNTNDGSPTSWSGAIDSISFGTSDRDPKRLFIISAGNVQTNEMREGGYPDACILHSVESPAQAWNAITVGAYNNLIQINDPIFENYNPVADAGDLSPYSSTSITWKDSWPIKPEILCHGGNMASDGQNFSESEELSLLTTNSNFHRNLFSSIWATSSAAAQAAYTSAKIAAEYPNIWPETIRGLIIHSSRWTDKMKQRFCIPDTKQKGRRTLLRTCGYGIPDLSRALQCMNNNVNLVIEGVIQPFEKDHMHEMHMHKIPWPKAVLRDLGEVSATLRVTLSYFIEPSPGEVGWKDKYRYSSCGLRFDVIDRTQTKEDFEKWVNIKMRGEDRKDNGEGSSGSDDWFLGPDNRNVGSIHSDYKMLSAVELCEAEYVAVYPVIGWWRERPYLKRTNSKLRYSLIVSISTPSVDVDLYTPIVTQIRQEITITT